MPQFSLSVNEHAVLGLLSGGPSHGFALARELEPDQPIGRILTVRRPLVYRALDRLVESGLARPVHTEKGDAGPNRTILRVTAAGRRELSAWLAEPVSHVRDIRLEFLLKVALLKRRGDSPVDLVRAQRLALDLTLDALDDPDPDDHVERWRHHVGLAARAYLGELESELASS